MVKMGFPKVWIERMMCCVSTSSFSVKIMVKLMVISYLLDGSVKEALYLPIYFSYVQKGSLPYW